MSIFDRVQELVELQASHERLRVALMDAMSDLKWLERNFEDANFRASILKGDAALAAIPEAK